MVPTCKRLLDTKPSFFDSAREAGSYSKFSHTAINWNCFLRLVELRMMLILAPNCCASKVRAI